MKDSSLKNNDLIRILYRTDNSSTPLLHIMPSKSFLGSTTFFYINGPQLLFQWDFTSTVMQFWNIQALPYQPQIIWFLPVIAMPTLEEK